MKKLLFILMVFSLFADDGYTLGIYTGIKPKHYFKNDYGDDVVIMGEKIIVPDTEYKFILKQDSTTNRHVKKSRDGLVSLHQTQLISGGKEAYSTGSFKKIDETDEFIKIECSLYNNYLDLTPTWTLYFIKSSDTIICKQKRPYSSKFTLTKTGDCAGVAGGSANRDHCGVCDSNATNDNSTCKQDCFGDWGGSAILDNCDICVNGNTGKTPCIQDCSGTWGGYKVVDNCGVCNGDNSSCVLLWGIYYNIETTTVISRNSRGLTGEIPSEIGNLTNLTKLTLSTNHLTGEIPSEVCALIASNNLSMYSITDNNQKLQFWCP